MKILSAKINRKKFFVGQLLLVLFTVILNVCADMLGNSKMAQNDERLLIGWALVFLCVIIFFGVEIFLFNARGNDIGLSTGEKIGAFVAFFIPLISFFVLLYLLFKKGKDYEQFLINQERARLSMKDNSSKHMEQFSGLKGDLFADMKKFWILLFCIISFMTCVFYVPYNLVNSSNPDIIRETAHATIFEVPKDFIPRFTKIDYQAIAFRELLILFGCCAGYTASTIIKKK